MHITTFQKFCCSLVGLMQTKNDKPHHITPSQISGSNTVIPDLPAAEGLSWNTLSNSWNIMPKFWWTPNTVNCTRNVHKHVTNHFLSSMTKWLFEVSPCKKDGNYCCKILINLPEFSSSTIFVRRDWFEILRDSYTN